MGAQLKRNFHLLLQSALLDFDQTWQESSFNRSRVFEHMTSMGAQWKGP